MTKSSNIVLREDSDRVATLSLNRPQQGNSLSLDTIDALFDHLMALRQEKSIGVGARSARIFRRERSGILQDRFDALLQHDAGDARATPNRYRSRRGRRIGCRLWLVANADLAIASRDARFATPGVNIGLWCLTPMVALSRAVAPKHALQMLATGRLYDADFALKIGLVNEGSRRNCSTRPSMRWQRKLPANPLTRWRLASRRFIANFRCRFPTPTNMRGSW